MINVAGFGILTQVKLGRYFILFFKRLSQFHVLQYWICFLLGCPRLMTWVAGLVC